MENLISKSTKCASKAAFRPNNFTQAFLQWTEKSAAKIRTEDSPSVFAIFSESSARCSQIIDSLSEEMNNHIEIKLVKRLYDHLPSIITNETSSLQVALQDNLLTEIYTTGAISYSYPQFFRILDLLVHKNSSMRIIEIGAGTGGATRIAMQALCSDSGSNLYKGYTFTDVSTSFFAHAQEESCDQRSMVFKKLDLGNDPYEQALSPDHDLVIASQSLHPTPKMIDTVRNVRKMFRPGGKLLILEITSVPNLINLIFGTFPDFWNGIDDGRIDGSFLSKEQWSELLTSNGISGLTSYWTSFQSQSLSSLRS